MRIILDTNILISALITTNTPPAVLYNAWRTKRLFDLITSPQQIEELRRVLKYKKLQRFIKQQEAMDLVNNIDTRAIVVSPERMVDYSKDPDDNIILSTALAGEADYIITGDKRDLLDLKKVEGIPIITAAKAVKKLLNA